MSLNLISDPWIPVRFRDGSTNTIAPHQITESDILAPDWPRADLNLACYELLIGLVFLADPPRDLSDWRTRRKPSSDALKRSLESYAPAFSLGGAHPFLQEKLETNKPPGQVDMLFIDSAGENAVKKNSDLMVWRGRYGVLDPALAAMALYTLQAFAPAGGAGIRTSMRGGGPMITLIDLGKEGLWPFVWANVPYGTPAMIENLPWMRSVRLSHTKGSETYPQHEHPVEAFFGMPRRLQLVMDERGVTGVIQKTYGTNYASWRHPTSPYYRKKEGSELLPLHPKPSFGYRNWLGVCAADPDGLVERATCVEMWKQGRDSEGCESSLRVAGWIMNKMTSVTFLNSVQPLIELPENRNLVLSELICAADSAAKMLRQALGVVIEQGTVCDAVVEEFFVQTEPHFHECLKDLKAVAWSPEFALYWIRKLRECALALFDLHSVPGLEMRSSRQQEAIIRARLRLLAIQPKNKKFSDFFETVAMVEGEVT